MKKPLILAAIAFITLNSFSVVEKKKNNIEEDTRLVTWYYSCNDGTGHTGSFLASEGTTKEDAQVVASRICYDRRKPSLSEE
jgi:hypothetical protein